MLFADVPGMFPSVPDTSNSMYTIIPKKKYPRHFSLKIPNTTFSYIKKIYYIYSQTIRSANLYFSQVFVFSKECLSRQIQVCVCLCSLVLLFCNLYMYRYIYIYVCVYISSFLFSSVKVFVRDCLPTADVFVMFIFH